jgi:hypothetical protein
MKPCQKAMSAGMLPDSYSPPRAELRHFPSCDRTGSKLVPLMGTLSAHYSLVPSLTTLPN